MLNKLIAALLIVSILASGCAHTTANPVLVAQSGDDSKSCDGILNEMQQMVQAQAVAEEADRNKQIAANVALGVAGAFLLVPWFFMDTGNAATVEERAARARYQRLNQMQIDRKCPASTSPSPSSPAIAAQGALTSSVSTTAVVPTAAVARAADVAPAPAFQVASTGSTVSPAATSVPASKSKTGQDAWNVERLAEVKVCAAEPQALLIAKGPGSETYTVACTRWKLRGGPLRVRQLPRAALIQRRSALTSFFAHAYRLF